LVGGGFVGVHQDLIKVDVLVFGRGPHRSAPSEETQQYGFIEFELGDIAESHLGILDDEFTVDVAFGDAIAFSRGIGNDALGKGVPTPRFDRLPTVGRSINSADFSLDLGMREEVIATVRVCTCVPEEDTSVVGCVPLVGVVDVEHRHRVPIDAFEHHSSIETVLARWAPPRSLARWGVGKGFDSR